MKGDTLMKFYENQLNLGNIFEECSTLFEEHNPKLLALLNNYLDINQYISYEFKNAFTLILADLENILYTLFYLLLFYKRFLIFLQILF